MIHRIDVSVISISLIESDGPHLCLARAGDRSLTTGCCGSVRGSLATGGNRAGDFGILHVNKSLATSVAARTSGLGGLLVGDQVEGDEEDEVGGEDTHAGKCGEFLTSAGTHVRSRGEVGAGEVGVGRKVDEACFQLARALNC